MGNDDAMEAYRAARSELTADLTLLNLIRATQQQEATGGIKTVLSSVERVARGAVRRSLGAYESAAHAASIRPPSE